MVSFNLSDVETCLPRNSRLIGLDFGAKIIGVALSDVSRRIATPYGALRRSKLARNAAEIAAIAAREGAGALVIGLPLSMDGSLGPAAQAARDWAFALEGATDLPAFMFDERLSSAAVNRAMIDADLSRAKRAALVDAAAAGYFLQTALNSLS